MLGSRILDTIRTTLVRPDTRDGSPQAQLSRAKEHLADGRCVYVQMDFSRIGTHIIRVGDNMYSTDDQGRSFTHITEEKLAELVCSGRSRVDFCPRTMFPLAADELHTRLDRHHTMRARACEACSDASARPENHHGD